MTIETRNYLRIHDSATWWLLLLRPSPLTKCQSKRGTMMSTSVWNGWSVSGMGAYSGNYFPKISSSIWVHHLGLGVKLKIERTKCTEFQNRLPFLKLFFSWFSKNFLQIKYHLIIHPPPALKRILWTKTNMNLFLKYPHQSKIRSFGTRAQVNHSVLNDIEQYRRNRWYSNIV